MSIVSFQTFLQLKTRAEVQFQIDVLIIQKMNDEQLICKLRSLIRGRRNLISCAPIKWV